MDTLAVRNMNPGNLKDPSTGSFKSFSDPVDGKAALYNDLTSKMTGTSSTGLNGNSSLLEFAKTYAPASDKNDPVQYAANLANKLGVSPDEKIGNLQSRIDDFASAVASNEDPSVQYKPTNTGYNPAPYSDTGKFDFTGLSSSETTPPQPDTSLGGELAGRANQAGTALQETISGKINPISGVLQTVGAGAGAVGDIVNKGLELIPGVKAIEGAIGAGIGSLAQTDGGKSIIKSMQDFGKAHPELAKDLGAGFNIITAIPILRGLGVGAKLGMDAASVALKNQAEKTFADEASQVIGKTARGSEFLRVNPTVAKDMVDERLIPDIKGTNYDITEALNTSKNTVRDLNKEVQIALDNTKYSSVAENPKPILDNVLKGYTDRNGNMIEGFANSRFTPDTVVKTARGLTPQNGALWDKFEAGQASMRDINKLRSDLDAAVSSVYSKTTLQPIKKDIGATLAGAMRDFVQSNVPETQNAFARMSRIYKVQDGLKLMSEKPVKPGMIGSFIKASTSGLPIVGHVGNKAASSLAGSTVGILKRTGRNAVRTSKEEAKTKLSGMVKGALLQKANTQGK